MSIPNTRGDSAIVTNWTAERVEQLEGLWKQGLSCTEIGKLIGATRSGVIGKVHRLGLPKRRSPTLGRTYRKGDGVPRVRPSVAKADVMKITEKRYVAHNAVKAAKRRAEAPTVCAPTVIVADVLPATARPWEERGPGRCAFPITVAGKPVFSCCAPCPGGVYCGVHLEKMYVRRAA